LTILDHINASLHQLSLVVGRQRSYEDEFPGLLEEVIDPPLTEPEAEVIRLKPNQPLTTPPPRHSPAA
jgi:hypothetical protein